MYRSMKKSEFPAVYHLLESAFPANERRPLAAQRQLLTNPRYRVAVSEQDGRVAAFLASWRLPEFRFIEHFAVCTERRSCGLGQRMLQTFLQESSSPAVLEVELPDTELARRRIGFYERNGFHLNSYRYFQPPMAPGQLPLPLLVMSSGGGLSECTFQRVRDELYRRIYHVLPTAV